MAAENAVQTTNGGQPTTDGAGSPSPEAGTPEAQVLSEEQIKAIRSLPFYQTDISAAQKPIQQQLEAAKAALKRAEDKLGASDMDADQIKALTDITKLAEMYRSYYVREGVPEERLASSDPSTIMPAGDAFLAGRGNTPAAASGTNGTTPEIVAQVLKALEAAKVPQEVVRGTGGTGTSPGLQELVSKDTRGMNLTELKEHEKAVDKALNDQSLVRS